MWRNFNDWEEFTVAIMTSFLRGLNLYIGFLSRGMKCGTFLLPLMILWSKKLISLLIKMLHWAGIRSQWFSRFFPLSEIRVPVHFPSFGHDFSWRNYVHLIFPTQIFRWQIGRQSENLLPQINAKKWKSSPSWVLQRNKLNSVLIFHSHHQNGNKWLSTFFPQIYGSISHWSLHLKSC